MERETERFLKMRYQWVDSFSPEADCVVNETNLRTTFRTS